MSTTNPMLGALRDAHDVLATELAAAERDAADAESHARMVRDHYQAFRDQLAHVCEAAGIPLVSVLDGEEHEPKLSRPQPGSDEDRSTLDLSGPNDAGGASDRRTGSARRSTQSGLDDTIALPCRPETQRWYAGQALHRLGGQAHVDDVADEMRRLGYQHDRAPVAVDQLKQSLAALPNQVTWAGRGRRPGHLVLDL